MKRTALALTVILTLFSVTFAVQAVKVAKANPIYIKPFYCRISIQSPQNRTYNTEHILLNFTAKINQEVFDSYPFFYILDGQDGQSSVKVEEIQVIGQERISNDVPASGNISYAPYTEYTLWGQAVLSSLSDGRHNLTVFMGADWVISNQTSGNPLFGTVDFSVDATSLEASSENWVEVTRFSGSSAHGSNFTTEPFTCDHVIWRIRWESDSGHGHFPNLHNFSVTTYPQGEDIFYVDSIFETGLGKKNGTSYIRDSSGEFYMRITTGIIEHYTIIVEQDINSIPEFPSWTPMLSIIIVLAVVLTVYKQKLHKTQIQNNQK